MMQKKQLFSTKFVIMKFTSDMKFIKSKPMSQKRIFLKGLSDDGLCEFYTLFGYDKKVGNQQMVNQLANHNYNSLKKTYETIRLEIEYSILFEGYNMIQIRSLADRGCIFYEESDSKQEIIKSMINNPHSIKYVITYDEENDSNADVVLIKFLKMLSDDVIRMLCNMLGLPVDEDDTIKDLRYDLELQSYLELFSLYGQLIGSPVEKKITPSLGKEFKWYTMQESALESGLKFHEKINKAFNEPFEFKWDVIGNVGFNKDLNEAIKKEANQNLQELENIKFDHVDKPKLKHKDVNNWLNFINNSK